MRITRIVSIFLVSAVPFCSVFAFDDGDFQYWNTESISWKVDGIWKLSLNQEFRSGDNGGNLYYYHTALVATYSGMAKWLDVGLRFRKVSEEKNSEWKDEIRPAFEAALKGKLSHFDLSNRGRFEYRAREDAEDYWRYRNKVTIKLPFKLTRFAINPYIADEVFYDFNVNMLDKNRFYGGISFKIAKHLQGDIYYLWQSDKKRVGNGYGWKDTNILGTKLKFPF